MLAAVPPKPKLQIQAVFGVKELTSLRVEEFKRRFGGHGRRGSERVWRLGSRAWRDAGGVRLRQGY